MTFLVLTLFLIPVVLEWILTNRMCQIGKKRKVLLFVFFLFIDIVGAMALSMLRGVKGFDPRLMTSTYIMKFMIAETMFGISGICACILIVRLNLLKTLQKWIKECHIEYILNIVCGIIIVSSVIVAYRTNCVDRSLWLDEASLWAALRGRGLLNLTDGPLGYMQSAPIIYIYCVKVFSIVLGNSEYIIRMPSFLAYCGLIIYSIRFCRKSNVANSMIVGAWVASISIIIRYSTEFKPYMMEAFFVVLIFYLYADYEKDKVLSKWYKLIIITSILIWGGNPTCFAIGGIIAVEMYYSLMNKSFSDVRRIIISGLVVVSSFIIYYFYWLKPVIDAGGMSSYWAGNRFPLLFFTRDNWGKTCELVWEYMKYFNSYKYIIAIIFAFGCVIAFYERQKEVMAMMSMLILALFASSLGLFPIKDRIWLFFYPIIIVVVAYSLQSAIIHFEYRRIACIFILFLGSILFLNSQGIVEYYDTDNRIVEKCSINPVLSFCEQELEAEDKVYIVAAGNCVVKYKLEDQRNSIGCSSNNIFYGSGSYKDIENREDIEMVANNPNIYIIGYFATSSDYHTIKPLLKGVSERGYLYKVFEDSGTPLWFYSDEILADKIDAVIKYEGKCERDGIPYAKISVKNLGEYYVGNGYNDLYIGTEDGRVHTVINKQLASGEGTTVEVSLKRLKNADEEVELNLYLEDQYSFKELGTESIVLVNGLDGWMVKE